MRPYKTQKIDLNGEYPCPCRRRGRLLPIVLTEAFGCNRCQQIFVLKDNGQAIEQLSSIYPKRAWRWTGYRWTNAYPNWTGSYISVLLAITLVLPILIFPLALQLSFGQSIIFWAIILLLLTILSTITLWLANRR